MANALAKLDKATQMLAEAKSLDEIKNIIDIAEAARTYARAAKLGLEAYNHAAEVKARAERKAGEFFKKLDHGEHGGNRKSSSTPDNLNEFKQIALENKIPLSSAYKWEQVAEMPEKVFEKHIQDMRGEHPITTSGMIKELKTDKRTEARADIARAGAKVAKSDRWHIYHGDIATWQAPRQYDYIITDPPYPKEFLPLYETLSVRSNELLKEGGLLIAMCGQSYLDQIYEMMSKHIAYYWTAAYLTPGATASLRQKQVNTQWKPLLIFSKGDYKGKIFSDVFTSGENDKDHHKWGQSESGMFDIISKICLAGQYILDPFCGAGTTGIAALRHECLFDGLEKDVENVNISKWRLYDATKN